MPRCSFWPRSNIHGSNNCLRMEKASRTHNKNWYKLNNRTWNKNWN